jgi:hypothetical protein
MPGTVAPQAAGRRRVKTVGPPSGDFTSIVPPCSRVGENTLQTIPHRVGDIEIERVVHDRGNHGKGKRRRLLAAAECPER